MMGTGSGYGSNWYGTMMSGYGSWLVPLVAVLVLAGIVVIIALLVRKR